MIFEPAVIEGRLRPLKYLHHMRVDSRALDGSRGVGDSLAVCSIKMRPDDLLRIADNRKVRVVRNHNDLPTLLSLGEHWHKKTHYSFVVEVFFRLIQNYWVAPPVHQQIEDQEQSSPLT